MLTSFGVALAVVAWLGLLFAVAIWGERHPWMRGRLAAVAYSLALAVYCTSWTFYGTVSQGVRHGWWLPPTFLGTILLYVFAFPFLRRLLSTAKSVNATSVADFIASRFGQSSGLAALVTGVVVVGMLPYVALQLKAVAMSYSAMVGGGEHAPAWQDSALYVAATMAVFAMLFGTRSISSTQANRGLITAMAFEAIFKLGAMLTLGLFVVAVLYDGPMDLWTQWSPAGAHVQEPRPYAYVTLAGLGMLAMFTLPHQFHIGVVECGEQRQLETARWLFPLFLLLISLPIWPLAAAGTLRLADMGLPSDLYVLGLPLSNQAPTLSLLVLIGGIAAASGMVIMASLSISIMVGNHWAAPWLLRRGWPAGNWLGDVRTLRRLGIAGVMVLGYAYSRALASLDSLAEIGAQSFSALAQLAPAVILAVYRPSMPPRAIASGIAAGFLLWAYVLIVPLVLPDWASAAQGIWSPNGLFGLENVDALSRGVWCSLGLNLAVLLAVAQWAGERAPKARGRGLDEGALRPIAQRFLDHGRFDQLVHEGRENLEARVAHELTAVIGAASTKLLLDAARPGSDQDVEQVASIVGDATQAARFSQQVLGAALENMSQGISVVDAQLRLVAWNRRYAEMFAIPDELLQIGHPIEHLIRHCASRLRDHPLNADHVTRRLNHLRAGTPHLSERRLPDDSIIEIRGQPMLGGGFVTTFTDVTEFRSNEQALTAIAETLEQRVQDRTAAAESARADAEQANQAKSRLLAAITHDLAQPLNAARLFGHALARKTAASSAESDVDNLLRSIESAEGLLSGLLDISRLGAGAIQPQPAAVALESVLRPLAEEFRVLAAEKGLELRYRATQVWVHTDAQMLRRVVQNFLTNAVRYTERGAILLGARRRGDHVWIQVWDSGPGIAEHDRTAIFEEFRRLDRGGRGLGLGLAIAERMAHLLDAELALASRLGHGSVFSIGLATCAPAEAPRSEVVERVDAPALRVLVVDNDAAVLQGMQALLESWGCSVRVARQSAELQAQLRDFPPDMLMLDYHLDGGDTGLALRQRLPEALQQLPCVLITADHDLAIRQAAEAAGCTVLHKPLKPLALKSVMARVRGAA